MPPTEHTTVEAQQSSTPVKKIQPISEISVDDLGDKELKELNLYTRCVERKQLFVPNSGTADSAPGAAFFILNPVPRKSAHVWRPHFYAGDNPKYDETSAVIGRVRRNGLWSSFNIELGEGVAQEVENKNVRKRIKTRKRVAWIRRKLHMKEKIYENGPGEEKEVTGRVIKMKLQRGGWGKSKGGWRVLRFELEGVEYYWRGTRERAKGLGKTKGLGHGLKLVRASDGVTIATFSKTNFSMFNKTERLNGPPNKKRSYIGSLQILPAANLQTDPTLPPSETQAEELQEYVAIDLPTEPTSADMGKPAAEGGVSDMTAKEEKEEHTEAAMENTISPQQLLEATITFTAWIAVEAEHRLRHKVVDVIIEIAELLGDG